eukprot:gene27270-33964_t
MSSNEYVLGVRRVEYYSNSHFVKMECIIGIAKACPLLQSIELSGYAELQDHQIKAVIDLCPLLHTVKLLHNRLITIDSFNYISEHCEHIHTLEFSCSDQSHFDDSVINLVASRAMRHLVLSECDTLTDTAISFMANGDD